MKIATVDIGTNSMRLLIADYDNNTIKNRKKYVNVTKIGRDVDEKRIISKSSIDRNCIALEEFIDIAKKENCEDIKVIGTSALRDSKNSDEFVSAAFEKTGVKVDIVSGSLEAKLGFLGVKNILDEKYHTLTIDIGGGSTEFILGDSSGEMIFSKSEDIGCVRLTEKFLKSDVASDFEIGCVNDYINTVTNETIELLKKYKIGKYIGIGGTATSISSMLQELEIYDSNKVHNSKIYYEDLINLYEDLKNKTLQEKQMIKGLQVQRADVIFAGVCILKNIMSRLEIEYITVSEYDNLEGMIYYYTQL